MKSIASMLLFCLLSTTGCAADREPQKAFIYEGVCYVSDGRPIPAEVDPSAYLGCIESVVPETEWPTEEKQANFPSEGEPFAMCNGKMHAVVNNEWSAFEPIAEE